ncbi:hypothetical protein KU6B_45140 [Mameliella alba]|nr:hypothetical protein KU6B_45140 [Mameliella alba]
MAAILAPLRRDAGPDTPPTALMTHVICDESWPEAACRSVTARHGIPCHRLPAGASSSARYDEDGVARLLVSLD